MTFLKKNQLFLILSLFIALIDGAFVYLTNVQSNERLQAEQEQQAKVYFSAFDIAYQVTKENMLQVSTVFANDPVVKKLFLKGKIAVVNEGGGSGGAKAKIARDKLYDAVANNWQQFTEKFHARQLHFHLGPGSTSFLRVHKPHKFGDNMDTVRYTIVDTNKLKQQVSGFETGKVYSGIRGVTPVFAINAKGEEEHVGAVEAGNSFAIVLKNFSSKLKVNSAVFLYEEHLRQNVWPEYLQKILANKAAVNGLILEQATTGNIIPLVELANATNSRIVEGSNISLHTLLSDNRYYLYASQPLRDYLGTKNTSAPDAGQIIIWRDVTDVYAVLKRDLLNNILYACFAFLIIEIIIYFVIRLISDRLNKVIVSQTYQIEARSRVLEQLSKGASIHSIFELIIKTIEQIDDSALCSILLVDKDRKHLLTGAAPSLPSFYNEAVDGVKIADGMGSCGTAAYTKKRVIVENIQTHSYWRGFKSLATKANLKSCWSEPILNASNELLGTFAIYHREPKTPHKDNIKIIESWAQLVALAIDRNEANKKLRLSSRVFNEAHEAIMITDKNLVITDVNPAFCRLTGYEVGEVIGEKPSVLSSGKQGSEFYAEMWKSIKEKGFWQGELWNYKKNSELFSEMLNISVLKDEKGNVSHYVGLFSDNTYFKKLEAKQIVEQENATIRASISQILQEPCSFKQRIEEILAILCQIKELNMQQKAVVFLITEQSNEFKMFAVHGQVSDEIVFLEKGFHYGECFCKHDTVSGHLKVSDNCFSGDEQLLENMLADDHYVIPLGYAGKALGILFLYTESAPIIDKVTMQLLSNIGLMMGLAIANEQARNALREEKTMAEKANHAKSEFLSSMSHELRTPLNSILGFSQLLETDSETPLNQEQLESVNYIYSSGQHLLNLINEVLELSAIEAGKVNILIKSIGLKEAVKDSMLLVTDAALEKNIQLNVLSGEQDIMLQADETKLKQVLINLINNAIKYNKENGQVDVTWHLYRNPNRVRINIIDTGVGISEANHNKVFSAFDRLGHENSTIEGTGIGLVVTKNLIELMSGEIGFESIEGKGSTFWIELPVLEVSDNRLVEI